MKKAISIVLLTTILLHSCVVYQKTPVPLSESYDKGKVKVITKTNKKLKFKKIIQKDSLYYGFNRKKLKNDYGEFEWVEITKKLNSDEVKAIYLKDQNGSTTATITFTILIAIPLAILGFYILAHAIF